MSDKSHLLILTSELDLLKRLAVEAYPEECCGVLLGHLRALRPWRAEVCEVAVARNSATDRRLERYVIDPQLLLRVQKEARQRGMDVVGYYHSHPDHGATPGQFDLDTAWPDVAYLILAVAEERVTGVRCWHLRKGGETFDEVEIGYS